MLPCPNSDVPASSDSSTIKEAALSGSSLGLFDIVAFFTLLLSFVSVLLLAFGAFSGRSALLLGVAGAAFFVVRYRRAFSLEKPAWRTSIKVFLIVALFVLFRFEPYRYEIGGQDQGAYVNMSRHFDDSSGVYVTDKVRETIKDDPALLTYYDTHNHSKWVLWDTYYFHIPGLFIHDLNKSQYIFQFYHLHSLWMSIFSGIAGPHNRSWSNVYFSLLSLCALAFGIFYCTGKKDTAFLTAAVLAVHPVHAYFAKLPVSETPTLAFASLGLMYLARFWRFPEESFKSRLFLFFSAASFFCLFLTRVSGFLQIPFFLVLFLAARLTADHDRRRRLSLYVLAVLILYMVSVLYGLTYSPEYSLHIYQETCVKFLGLDNWQPLFLAGLFVLPAFVLTVHLLSEHRPSSGPMVLFNWVFDRQFLLFKLILVAAVFQTAYLYIARPDDIFTSPSFVFFSYVWPVVPAILAAPEKWMRDFKARPVFLMLCVWLNIFAIFQLFISRSLGYQYFYARYQFSDFIPFALVLGSLCAAHWSCSGRRGAAAVAVLFFAGFCYWSFFSVRQIGRKEAEGSHQTLEAISAAVPAGGLLLIVKEGLKLDQEIKMGLSIYQKVPVFDVAAAADIDQLLPRLKAKYSKIILLSPEPLADRSAQLSKELTYRQETFGYWRIIDGRSYRTRSIPMRTVIIEEPLYLYNVTG